MCGKKSLLCSRDSRNIKLRRVAILCFLQLSISGSFIISPVYAQAPTPPLDSVDEQVSDLGQQSAGTNLCALLTPSLSPPDNNSNIRTCDYCGGPVHVCDGGIILQFLPTPAEARRRVEQTKGTAGTYGLPSGGSLERFTTEISSLGDYAVYLKTASFAHVSHTIEFAQGRYYASATCNYELRELSSVEPLRAAMATLSERLSRVPEGVCEGASPQVTTTVPPTIVRVKDPTTGSWVTWLLIPGVGLVLYAAAKLLGRKKPEDKPTRESDEQPNSKPDEQPKEYELDIRTQDDRTSLNADGEDILWVYAQVRCNKPEVNTEALTAGLTFTAEGTDAKWLSLGLPQRSNGFKTVPVRAWPPSQDAQLIEGKAVVMVSTFLEGNRVNGPVKLDLEPKYVMEFV